jgi:stearoyl-CoA desaturase (Delta-9 desaturase)
LSAQSIKISRGFTPLEHFSNALFVGMHLSLLFVFVVKFSWGMVALALAGYALRMWAITAGYHRYFAHRSYKTSRAWQLVLAILGSMSMQNGPIWWASVHRRHHKYSDHAGDPHSPVLHSFWYAHAGWIFDKSVPDPRDDSNVRDLMRYPELRWIDGHDWVPLVTYAVGCFAIGGWSGLVWGFVVSTLAVFHVTALINSLAHVRGSRRYDTDDGSRNNAFLAVLTFGEGWHNNHHHYQSAARQGVVWWEIDVTYYVLRLLATLGIIWDVRERPRERALPQPGS